MIVEPDFLDHWKTKLLERRLGDRAPLLLIRLWSHCHSRRMCRFPELTDDMLAAICRWEGDAEELRKALMEGGWLEEELVEDVSWMVVHDWEQTNATLARNWRNGAKGGRPKKTQGKPKDNPEQTDWKGLEGMGRDGKGLDGNTPLIPQGGSEGENPSSDSDRSPSVTESTSEAQKISAGGEVLGGGVMERSAALAAVFRRERGVPWSGAEEKALDASGLIELPGEKFVEQLELVTGFYRAQLPEGDLKWVRRTTLKALLNNWGEMVDKARAWRREHSDGVVVR